MRKYLLAFCALLVCVSVFVAYDLRSNFYICPIHGLSRIVDDMPLVDEEPFMVSDKPPDEQRGPEYVKWMKTGVKIMVSRASGSGTIVYFDPQSGEAYVQSCGHLWNGNMTAEEGKTKNITCQVQTWYHNETKLPQPATYPASVIFYSNTRGQDCSLLKFKPDWIPDYYPIGPDNFVFQPNMNLHSVGCDGGREIAHYTIMVVGMRTVSGEWQDVVTAQNSPRPGRSGGGLMSDDGYYVGICWGTSDYSGTGNGYFTPLKTIRYFNQANGYGWLNDVGVSLARQIPIVDRNNPQQRYPHNYIPLPNGRYWWY
jgi:hypothetical protein